MATKKKRAGVDLAFAAAKLASSGLTEEQGAELGMSVVRAAKLDPLFHDVRALQIVYHGIDGKDSGFYRIRYLEDLPGFAGAIAKPQRYAQPAGTLNWVYLPKINGTNWEVLAKDVTQPLLITEGELKAACACAHEWPCVALGGVTVWQSSKKKVPLLPPLNEFQWKNRPVTIIFDSDAATNPQVAQAQIRLSEELLRLGAVPTIAALPPTLEGEKQGLDDFIVSGGNVQGVIDEAIEPPLAEAFVGMNTRFAYVRDQDLVVELDMQRRIKRESLVNGLLANHKIVEFRVNARTGQNVRTEIPIAKRWLEWNCRHDVGSMVYEPGAARIVDENYNLWCGWGCKPKKGGVKPWVELMDFLFYGGAEERVWFERWLAYPLQHPGAKMYAAAVLWGPETGTGKSLIGHVMSKVYGTNYAKIGNEELHNAFNEWSINKQFILGDEITGSDKRIEADKLKGLITQHKLRINMKHLPTYEVRDCLNYYFTSNHPDAFFLDDQDRRFFVWRVQSRARERSFYSAFTDWLDKGGAENLFQYFLDMDLGNFDPVAPAPETESKREMVDHAKSDVASFVKYLMNNLDRELLRLQDLLALSEAPELLLNKHLLLLYDPDGTKRVTANGLGREMTRYGVKTLPPVKTATFGLQRFYVLREHEKWFNTKPADIRDYVDSVFKGDKVKKF